MRSRRGKGSPRTAGSRCGAFIDLRPRVCAGRMHASVRANTATRLELAGKLRNDFESSCLGGGGESCSEGELYGISWMPSGWGFLFRRRREFQYLGAVGRRSPPGICTLVDSVT
jgi:hypothetical protein